MLGKGLEAKRQSLVSGRALKQPRCWYERSEGTLVLTSGGDCGPHVRDARYVCVLLPCRRHWDRPESRRRGMPTAPGVGAPRTALSATPAGTALG